MNAAATDLDPGPLSWVRGEIDLALGRAGDSLEAWRRDPRAHGDELQRARLDMRQARGALAMLCLDGVAQYASSLEQLLDAFDAAREPDAAAVEAAQRAMAGLRHYLDELVAGAPDQPLRLLPLYQTVERARGADTPSAADLFFPDLAVSAPPRDKEPPALPAALLQQQLRFERGRYQRGFLHWLRGSDVAAGIADMKRATAAIERTQRSPSARTLWWVARSFLDALGQGLLSGDSRRTCSHIDAQMRRMVDGAPSVSDKLLRELLYQVALAQPGCDSVEQVRTAFALDALLPAPEAAGQLEMATSSGLKDLRDTLAAAKDAWERFCAGAAVALPQFDELAQQLAGQLPVLGEPRLERLAGALRGVARWLRREPLLHNDTVAMEVATALLLADHIVATHGRRDPLTLEHALLMTQRLDALMHDRALEPITGPLLGEISRQAQERLLIRQVTREIQANLAGAEQVLDSFFRDPSRHGELAKVAAPLRQVEGALEMLGQGDAAQTLRHCSARIAGFAAGEAADRPQCEALAQQLSALGFFVDALQHKPADLGALLASARQRGPGAGEAVAEEESAPGKPGAAAPCESSVPLSVPGELRHGSAADRGLLLPPSEAPALEAANDEEAAGTGAATLAAPAKGAADAAPPPAPPVFEEATEEESVDDDILGIFIEEARELLSDIDGGLRELRGNPADADLLGGIRRRFHTLKGSGRMVGLHQFAEASWNLEYVLNDCLQHGHTLTPELDRLVGEARHALSTWVSRIENGGGRTHDWQALRALAEDILGAPVPLLRPPPGTFTETAAGAAPSGVGEAPVAAEPEATAAPGQEQPVEPEEEAPVDMEPAAAAQPEDAAGARPETLADEIPLAEFAEIPSTHGADATTAAFVERLRIARPEQARRERRRQRLDDELDEQLLPVFLEESQDLVRSINGELRLLRADPSSNGPTRALARLLHTLKGSARMAGAMGLGELVHSMETRLEDVATRQAITPPFLDEFDASFDRVVALLDELRHGGEAPAEALEPAQEPVSAPGALAPAPSVAVEGEPEPAQGAVTVRVRSDLLDRLQNEAGEIGISRARVDGELRQLRHSLIDLTENVARLRRQLREIEIQAEMQMQSRLQQADESHAEFDPLEFDRFTRFQEVTRMMVESVNDVATVQLNLLKNLDSADAALAGQARLNRSLAQALMGVRMTPFNTIADRLYRVVRQSAKELGKRANLDIQGGRLELDRSVLDRVAAPLEHLLRNAVYHGIETVAERREADKPEIGQITLRLAHEGNEVSVELADDGAGLDFERIRSRAVTLGMLSPEDRPAERELIELIFRPGFSTAAELTEISGRGVGMDVVRSEVASLGGRIEVQSDPGHGSGFRVFLPQTLAMIQALLAVAAGKTYAIPASMVEQVLELKSDAMGRIMREGAAEWRGTRYPYHFLPRLIGVAQGATLDTRYSWVVLVRSGAQRVAVHVEELRGNHEIVVKDTGPQLARLVGVVGATVMGNGEVVLILNPVALASRELTFVPQSPAAAAAQATAPTVMVVDDSLTVRKITSRLLEREGYRVITAKDGVDALEQLLDVVPDVMLVDIEMPRMDGFDLTRNVRADARLKAVPIIMITSRIAEKHRNYARELGVNFYLGKPYQEEELLGKVAQYARRREG